MYLVSCFMFVSAEVRGQLGGGVGSLPTWVLRIELNGFELRLEFNKLTCVLGKCCIP